MPGMSWQKKLTESKYDNFAELIRQRQAEQAIETIKEYCLSHKNCNECGLYNGVCRVNQFPFNWDSLTGGTESEQRLQRKES